MAKKNRLMEIRLSDAPAEWAFYSAKVPTKLMRQVESKRAASGVTAKHLIKEWCERYVQEEG